MVMRIIFDCVILAAIALGQWAMATPARAFEPVAVLLGSAPVDSLPAYWAFLQASILNKVMTKSVFAKALGLAEKDVLGTRFQFETLHLTISSSPFPCPTARINRQGASAVCGDLRSPVLIKIEQRGPLFDSPILRLGRVEQDLKSLGFLEVTDKSSINQIGAPVQYRSRRLGDIAIYADLCGNTSDCRVQALELVTSLGVGDRP